ncbi:MAG: glycosyltransferase family 39 protein [Candidatus Kaelpia imicola]|nr:glycosyltransferase family 39 protein [Candidatus Kaelpia imicola]
MSINKIDKKNSKHLLMTLLSISALLFIAINLLWEHYNFNFSYMCMGSDNFNSIIDLFINLQHDIGFLKDSLYLSYGHSSYPSLYFLIHSLTGLILGRINHMTVVTVNSVIVLISALFSYKISSVLKNRSAGCISFIILTLYPATYGISRYPMLETLILALVPLIIYLIIKSQNFSNTKYSILLGLSLCLGLLTKYHFLIFVVPGIIYELFKLIINWNKNSTSTNKTKCLNIALIIFIALAPAIGYYVKNYKEIIRYLLMSYSRKGLIGGETIPSGSLNSWFFYLFTLINYQLSLPFFLVFISGTINLIFRKKIDQNFTHLWLAILIPYLFLQTGDVKWARYSIGYIPICAIISAIFISGLKKGLRNTTISVLFLFGITQNISSSFLEIKQKPLLKTKLFKDRDYYDAKGNIYPLLYNYEVRPPDYNNKIIFQSIIEQIKIYSTDKLIIDMFIRESKSHQLCSEISAYLKIYADKHSLKYRLIFTAKDIEQIIMDAKSFKESISVFRIMPEEESRLYSLSDNIEREEVLKLRLTSTDSKNLITHLLLWKK